MNISFLKRPPREDDARPFAEPPGAVSGQVAAIGALVKKRLWELLARECEAMAQHALSTGRTVPAEVLEQLEQALSTDDAPSSAEFARRGSAETEQDPVSSAAPARISSLVSLGVAHSALALIIAPATPEAVRLMADEREKHPRLCAFGPLPVVRRMLGLAILSLCMLLGVSLSQEVNVANMSKNLLEMSGYKLFIIEIFLLSAGSLGSCFSILQKINSFISDGTYNPKFQSTYWTRWVMGVISGIVLSQLIYRVLFVNAGQTSNEIIPSSLGQPILALLGGYSFEVVYGLLNHTIDTLSGFFRGPRENQERARPAPGITDAVAQEGAVARIGVKAG